MGRGAFAAASLAVLVAVPATAAGIPRQSVVSRMSTMEPSAPTGSHMEMRRAGPIVRRASTATECAGTVRARRSGPNIVASEIRVVRVGCRSAKRLLRRYFRKVLRTAQTPGGCAQRRTTVGCRVRAWRCTVRYRRAANRLAGRCARQGERGKRVIRFDERDTGPG